MMQIHHIGYLVKKIDRAIEAFESLGYQKETDIIFDASRGIDLCFMNKNGYRIELVSPKTKESVVSGLSKRIGNGPYHFCYTCNDLSNTIDDLCSRGGYVMYESPHEAIAFSNRTVCFLIHPYVGMIELLEEK